jgi:hypothetical protein
VNAISNLTPVIQDHVSVTCNLTPVIQEHMNIILNSTVIQGRCY